MHGESVSIGYNGFVAQVDKYNYGDYASDEC
jgi:hypothetical protein